MPRAAMLETRIWLTAGEKVEMEPAPYNPGEYLVTLNGHVLGFATTEALGRFWAALYPAAEQ